MYNLVHEYIDSISEDEFVTAYIFLKNMCLLTGGDMSLPRMAKRDLLSSDVEDIIYLGRLDGVPCFAAGAGNKFEIPDNCAFYSVRTQLEYPATMLWSAGYALHVHSWHCSHKYCSRCGHKVEDSKYERAKLCPKCDLVAYPQISPAIIISVTRGDKILLVRKSFYEDGYYAMISGFMEPGESVELSIEREVFEEVGIHIKNIKYSTSQPWPFPDNIMLGFTAEYDSGDITLSSGELEDASWFSPDGLPKIPGIHSIARRLIDDFCEERRRYALR